MDDYEVPLADLENLVKTVSTDLQAKPLKQEYAEENSGFFEQHSLREVKVDIRNVFKVCEYPRCYGEWRKIRLREKKRSTVKRTRVLDSSDSEVEVVVMKEKQNKPVEVVDDISEKGAN